MAKWRTIYKCATHKSVWWYCVTTWPLLGTLLRFNITMHWFFVAHWPRICLSQSKSKHFQYFVANIFPYFLWCQQIKYPHGFLVKSLEEFIFIDIGHQYISKGSSITSIFFSYYWYNIYMVSVFITNISQMLILHQYQRISSMITTVFGMFINL